MEQSAYDRTGETGLDMDRVREYVRLRRRERELGAQAEEVKAQADVIEQALLEEFAQDGVQSMSVDGMTVYLQRTLWARLSDGATREQAIDALRDAGLDHFVAESYNTQTLSSWLRDLEREEEPLPEALVGVIEGSEKYAIRTRRS